MLTDTSFSNIALWNGKEWHTPATPLFHGIKRAFYIHTEKIIPLDIFIHQLKNYQAISLLNAMLDLEDTVVLIKNVREG